MTCTTADIINSIPGIEGMTYLELGVQNGYTFDYVKAGAKTGVDLSTNRDDTLEMTTDEFFKATALTFDVVYIDADHDYPAPLTDYNNAVQRLNHAGLIFMHDLVPGDDRFLGRECCSDAYRTLVDLIESGANMMTLDHNYGLTVIFDAGLIKQATWNEGPVSYDDFTRFWLPKVEVVTRETMVDCIKEYVEANRDD